MDPADPKAGQEAAKKPPEAPAAAVSPAAAVLAVPKAAPETGSPGAPVPVATKVHIITTPSPTAPKVRQLSGGSKVTGVKVASPASISPAGAAPTVPAVVSMVTKSLPSGVTVTPEVVVARTTAANPVEMTPASITLKSVAAAPAPGSAPATVTVPAIVTPAEAQPAQPPQTFVLQTPTPPSSVATQHIRIPTIPTQIRPAPASTSASGVSRIPPTTTGGPKVAALAAGSRVPLSSPPAGITTVVTTTTGKPAVPAGTGLHQLPAIAPANLATKIIAAAAAGGIQQPQQVGGGPVSLAILPQPQQPQEGHPTPSKVTVVHAPAPSGQAATLEITSKPAGAPTSPATIKPITQGVTLSPGVPVTIRNPIKTGPGATNSPIQLVPISSGNARPTFVQQTRRAAPGGVTLIQSPAATITKLTSQGSGTLASKPTLVSTIGAATQGTPPRHLVPQQVISAAAAGAGQPAIRIGLQPAHASGTTSPAGRMTVMASPGSAPAAGGPAQAVALTSTAQLTVPAAHQQQPQTQQVARIITPGTRIYGVPNSAVSIQKAFVTTVATTQQQPGAKAAASVVSLPYGTSSITVPQPQAGGVSAAVTAAAGAIPVARVPPQTYLTPAAGAPAQNPPTAASAAASLFLSRPGQAPVSASELPLVMTPAMGHQGATTKITLGAPAVAAAAARIHQEGIAVAGAGGARLVPTSPSRPGILRRRGETERGDIIMERSSPGPVLPELSVTRLSHPPQSSQQQNDHDGGSSSGSTTVSATSSPCDNANYSGGEDNAGPSAAAAPLQLPQQPPSAGPSPRKKPRKQQHSQVRDHQGAPEWPEHHLSSPPAKRQLPPGVAAALAAAVNSGGSKKQLAPAMGAAAAAAPMDVDNEEEDEEDEGPARPPRPSLINSYRHTWKSRHNHFLRRTDVKVKDDKRPTVNELANQKFVVQKINGWKMYHVSSQMEDIVDIEHQFSTRLSSLQRKLDRILGQHSRGGNKEQLSKDLGQVQEIIKANLQRSKVIQTQVKESRESSIKMFEHKPRVNEIVARYLNKRSVKKRDLGRF